MANINFYTIKVRLLLLAIIILAENLILLHPRGRTSSVLEGWHLTAVECVTFPAKWEEAAISPFNLSGEISSPADLLLCTTVALQRSAARHPEWEEIAGSFRLRFET